MNTKHLLCILATWLLTVAMYAENVTLTLYSNGCSTSNVITCPKGQQLRINAVDMYGYHFTQWSDGNTTNPRVVTMNSNATYTAQFAPNQYIITTSATNGTVTGGGTYDYGEQVTLTATANAHYHFVQWSDGVTTPTRTITVSGDSTYTAEFAIDQHTISTSGTNGSVTGAGTYDYGTQVTLTATANAHYHFVQWSDCVTTPTRTITVSGDSTYTAEFAIDQHTISTSGTNGSVTGAGTYDYGKQVTLTATANAHYHFTQWSDGNTTNPRTITIKGDTTYTAQFAIDQHTITTFATNGTVTGAGTYDYGTQVTLTATANAHYHFVKWSDGVTTPTRTITVSANATYTAEFAIDQYTISTSGTNGSVTGAGTYDYGTQVTLTATANAHYHFVKWSDGVTTPTRTITVSANATYTAEFAIDQYTINTSGTNGSVTGAGTYDYGKQVTLTATANAHYHFVQWSDGITTPTRTITVSANATYTAEFAIDQYSITTKVNNATMGSVTGAGMYDYNAQIALYAIPEYGYEFSKWSDNNTDNPRSVTVTKNAQYMAVFVASKFAVTALSADDAMGSVTGGGDYSYNTNAIITAVPEKGFEFVMWDDGNTDNPRTILVTEEVIFMATFQPTSTALDDVKTNAQGGATKFVKDGILYILRDGKIYNAQGQKL